MAILVGGILKINNVDFLRYRISRGDLARASSSPYICCVILEILFSFSDLACSVKLR